MDFTLHTLNDIVHWSVTYRCACWLKASVSCLWLSAISCNLGNTAETLVSPSHQQIVVLDSHQQDATFHQKSFNKERKGKLVSISQVGIEKDIQSHRTSASVMPQEQMHNQLIHVTCYPVKPICLCAYATQITFSQTHLFMWRKVSAVADKPVRENRAMDRNWWSVW